MKYLFTNTYAVLSAALLALTSASTQAEYLYIASHGTNQVLIYPAEGGTATSFVNTSAPSGLVFDGAGNLYVANDSANLIYKYSSTGTLLTTLSGNGLSTPQGLAIDASGNLYAANIGNNTISRFDSDGNALTAWTLGGAGGATGIAFDSNFNLYAATQGTVQLFNSAGVLQPDFVSSGIDNATGLTFDLNGNLYVGDATYNAVFKFDSAGNQLTAFYGGGQTPYGLAVGDANRLYVANLVTGVISAFNEGDYNNFQNVVTGLSVPSFIAVSAVPEPGTVGLMVVAGLGVLVFWRSRSALAKTK